MKLRTKFLLSLLLVTTGLTGASLFIVRRGVRLHARSELSRELENSATTLRDFQARREQAAERTAELLADAPLLKAMMVTHDPATIQDASDDIWHSSGADLVVLADPSGRVMATQQQRTTTLPDGSGREARVSHSAGWWPLGRRVYQVFYHPIESGNSSERRTVGLLVLGYELSPLLAQQISHVADGPVAFRSRGGIVASTLNAEQTTALQWDANLPSSHGPAGSEARRRGLHEHCLPFLAALQ